MTIHSDVETTVVVGIDGSDHARSAVKWAADEAKLRGSVLRVVYAGTGRPRGVPGWYPEGGHDELPFEAAVEDAVGLVATRHPSVVVRGECVERAGAPGLIEASRGADLLVVGARGVGGFTGLLLGSVSHQCVEHGMCPVVVVHSDEDDPAPLRAGGRIVVGIDGSPGSFEALRWGLAEAQTRRARVDAIHGWHEPTASSVVTGPPDPYDEAAHVVADEAGNVAKAFDPTVPFEAVASQGSPVSVLLEASRGADLLVVGARGGGGWRALLLGSVARQCADHAPCPVVVVRRPVGEDRLAATA